MFFFFKQKTAYEMRISDWSSDVCSSDLKTLDCATLPSGACRKQLQDQIVMVNLGWLGLELLLAAAGAEVEAPALLLRHMAGSGPIHLHAADRVAHHVP